MWNLIKSFQMFLQLPSVRLQIWKNHLNIYAFQLVERACWQGWPTSDLEEEPVPQVAGGMHNLKVMELLSARLLEKNNSC